MQIAFIGSGNVARALGSGLVKAGHQVVLYSRDEEARSQAAGGIGARPAASSREAAGAGEVIVFAIPYLAAEQVSGEIAEEVAGKVVIDATNPLTPDYRLATEGGPSGAERIQGWLPQARVIKAFNTVFASHLANPRADGVPVDAYAAGDDEEAKRLVLGLAHDLGFTPIDAGGLARARELEGMAYLNISIQARVNGDWQSAWKLLSAPAAAVVTPAAATPGTGS